MSKKNNRGREIARKAICPWLSDDISQNNQDWQGWKPETPGQIAACASYARTIGVGGGAGGGKSALILILASLYHRRSLIIRRTYPNLRSLIGKSRELFNNSEASFNSQDKIWRNIPGNKDGVIEFGHCQHEKDKSQYQGQEHDLKAFDEAQQFPRHVVEYISSWNRTSDLHQQCRVLLTFNPPTNRDEKWITGYFAPWVDPNYEVRTNRKKAKPCEVRWFVVSNNNDRTIDIEIDESNLRFYFIDIDNNTIQCDRPEPVNYRGKLYYPKAFPVTVIDPYSGKEITQEPSSRTFIPMRLEDNTYLNKTDYSSRLAQLPEPLRSILMLGDFSVDFEQSDLFQVIPTSWVKAAQKRWTKLRTQILATHPQTAIGVDPFWGGTDRAIIAPVYGSSFVDNLIAVNKIDLEDIDIESTMVGEAIADTVKKHLEHLSVPVRIDVTGVGAATYEACKNLGLNAIAVNFAEAALDHYGERVTDRTGCLRFKNRRAQMFWQLRELLDPNQKDSQFICLPPDEELEEELTAYHYRKSTGGGNSTDTEIILEPKDLIKSKIKRSPDKADAVAIALLNNRESPSWDVDQDTLFYIRSL